MEKDTIIKISKLYRDLSNEKIDEFTFISAIQGMVAVEVGWDNSLIDFEATYQEISKAEIELD